MKIIFLLFILFNNKFIYSYNLNNNNYNNNSTSSSSDSSDNNNNSIIFNYDPWIQKFHDSSYSSYSLNNPITNEVNWSNNLNFEINNNYNNNNNSCKINLNYNPIILSDQSYITLNINNNNNNLEINKFSFYNELEWKFKFNNSNNCLTTTTTTTTKTTNNLLLNIDIIVGLNYTNLNSNYTSNYTYTPILVYIKEYSEFYIFNLDDGTLIWNSNSDYYNCSSINYYTSLYKFYSICQFLNNNNSISNNEIITNIIVIDPFFNKNNNSIIINNQLKFNLTFKYNDKTLKQSIYSKNELLFGYPTKYIVSTTLSYSSFIYINFKYGLVSMISSDLSTIYNQWKLPDNTINQISPVVLSNTGPLLNKPIITLMYDQSRSIIISSYYINSGQVAYQNTIVSNINSGQLFNCKLGVQGKNSLSIIFMFNYFVPQVLSYSGIFQIPSTNLQWYINGNKNGIYDFVSTLDTIYYCRLNDVYLINNQSISLQLNYPINYNNNSESSGSINDTSLSLDGSSSESSEEISPYYLIYDDHICKLSLGENSILITFNNIKEKESFTFKAIDSFCPNLCGKNQLCTNKNGCQCQPYYYPSENCSIYCYSDITCLGHGHCNQLGQCVCNAETGWMGNNCEVCGNGYTGNDCSVTFNLKKAIIFIVVGLIVTSSICIFAFCTRRIGKNKNKPFCQSCNNCWSKLLFKFKTCKFIKPKNYQSLNNNINNNNNNENENDHIIITDNEFDNNQL